MPPKSELCAAGTDAALIRCPSSLLVTFGATTSQVISGQGSARDERSEEENVKMNLKPALVMVSTMALLSLSSIRAPGSREGQQMREVVRFIAEVQDFLSRRGLPLEKSRSLIGGKIPCAANTIRGLLGSCRQHVIGKRKHSALHGLKALIARKRKANNNNNNTNINNEANRDRPDKTPDGQPNYQRPIKDLSMTSTKTEITTEPVTIIPGLNVFEELSVNNSLVTSDDLGQGSVPSSTIDAVISPFRKVFSAVTKAISHITTSVSGSFSSSDISGEQSQRQCDSQATEEEGTTGTPEEWETNTTLQTESHKNTTGEIFTSLTNTNNKATALDVVVTNIFYMLQNELSNETMPQQSPEIIRSLHLNELSHKLELEEADDAEDTTDSFPILQEDEPNASWMRGRTDQIEDLESNKDLNPDAEGTTESLLQYEDINLKGPIRHTSKIYFLNNDGDIV